MDMPSQGPEIQSKPIEYFAIHVSLCVFNSPGFVQIIQEILQLLL